MKKLKTLEDFTPEIKAKIPLYKKKVLENLCNGKEYEMNTLQDTVKYVHKIYELAGRKYKPIVVLAKNPIEYRCFFELFFNEKHSIFNNLKSPFKNLCRKLKFKI